MNRINRKFRSLKKEKKKAFIAFITAGDPSMQATERLVYELAANGADLIELGVPFSDPLADGPTIQAASERALKHNTNLKDILGLVKKLRKKTDIPLVLMTYYNPVFKYGLEKFAGDSKQAGVDGIIVPDLPPEEGADLNRALRRNGLDMIYLLAPTSAKGRIRSIAAKSKGFIYYVSLTGVTGARAKLPEEISASVKTIKRLTKTPVCVGFGISSPEEARRVARAADGIIVGSAIVKVIEKNLRDKDMVKKVGRFVKGLARAAHNA